MAMVFYNTPWVGLKIEAGDEALWRIDFVPRNREPQTVSSALLRHTLQQLDSYLQQPDFSFDLPLRPQGSDFQQRVWALLRQIPAGEVRTYGEIASQLGSSPRAVGNACRRNPLPLIVPCHRVVSAQGLGGFAGQTAGPKIHIKQQLLRHEGLEI